MRTLSGRGASSVIQSHCPQCPSRDLSHRSRTNHSSCWLPGRIISISQAQSLCVQTHLVSRSAPKRFQVNREEHACLPRRARAQQVHCSPPLRGCQSPRLPAPNTLGAAAGDGLRAQETAPGRGRAAFSAQDSCGRGASPDGVLPAVSPRPEEQRSTSDHFASPVRDSPSFLPR